MTDEMMLALLKQDLQLLHTRQDEYLYTLLRVASSLIQKEGIALTDSIEDAYLTTMYAAYLFRHRAESENKMPRMLRYALNVRLVSQKMGGSANGV